MDTDPTNSTNKVGWTVCGLRGKTQGKETPNKIWILVPGQYEDTEYCSKKTEKQFNGDKNTSLEILLLTISNRFGQSEVNTH